jgi:hypothetical protein
MLAKSFLRNGIASSDLQSLAQNTTETYNANAKRADVDMILI